MGNCAGVDWASEKHDVLIADDAGNELVSETFAHSESGITAVPDNIDALQAFRAGVGLNWQRSRSRRSQKGRVTWSDMWRIADRWLPQPRILHPWPTRRLDARTQARSPVR